MIPDLQDYGIIFLSIAIFGFIVLDIYKTGQGLGIPFYFKSNLEKIFHYISVTVLLFSFSLVIINMLLITAPNQDNFFINFIKSFFDVFQRSHEFGFISDESYIIILKFFAFSNFFAVNYIILYFILLVLGIFSRYNSMLRTNVYLKEKTVPLRFVKLITETEDFFFFEKEEKINLWEAIRRENIDRIETITSSTKFEIIFTNLIKSIQNYFHNRNR